MKRSARACSVTMSIELGQGRYLAARLGAHPRRVVGRSGKRSGTEPSGWGGLPRRGDLNRRGASAWDTTQHIAGGHRDRQRMAGTTPRPWAPSYPPDHRQAPGPFPPARPRDSGHPEAHPGVSAPLRSARQATWTSLMTSRSPVEGRVLAASRFPQVFAALGRRRAGGAHPLPGHVRSTRVRPGRSSATGRWPRPRSRS